MQYLTERELEILRRFANGESTRDIGTRLGISTSTVRTHTQNILNKLGLHSKVEAAAYAARATPGSADAKTTPTPPSPASLRNCRLLNSFTVCAS